MTENFLVFCQPIILTDIRSHFLIWSRLLVILDSLVHEFVHKFGALGNRATNLGSLHVGR